MGDGEADAGSGHALFQNDHGAGQSDMPPPSSAPPAISHERAFDSTPPPPILLSKPVLQLIDYAEDRKAMHDIPARVRDRMEVILVATFSVSQICCLYLAPIQRHRGLRKSFCHATHLLNEVTHSARLEIQRQRVSSVADSLFLTIYLLM